MVKEGLWLLQFYPGANKEVVEYGCWLHEIVHPTGGYDKDDHNVASAKMAEEFLNAIGYDKTKLKAILHCIESHRTSRGPDPETIEAKIVFSADNLSNFTKFYYMSKKDGFRRSCKKIKERYSPFIHAS
ncbi:MAG: HD domain-containing protein [Candidatus Pacearchaeota archaeon]